VVEHLGQGRGLAELYAVRHLEVGQVDDADERHEGLRRFLVRLAQQLRGDVRQQQREVGGGVHAAAGHVEAQGDRDDVPLGHPGRPDAAGRDVGLGDPEERHAAVLAAEVRQLEADFDRLPVGLAHRGRRVEAVQQRLGDAGAHVDERVVADAHVGAGAGALPGSVDVAAAELLEHAGLRVDELDAVRDQLLLERDGHPGRATGGVDALDARALLRHAGVALVGLGGRGRRRRRGGGGQRVRLHDRVRQPVGHGPRLLRRRIRRLHGFGLGRAQCAHFARVGFSGLSRAHLRARVGGDRHHRGLVGLPVDGLPGRQLVLALARLGLVGIHAVAHGDVTDDAVFDVLPDRLDRGALGEAHGPEHGLLRQADGAGDHGPEDVRHAPRGMAVEERRPTVDPVEADVGGVHREDLEELLP
jgi:hypothetical protein